jgi:hypothetical protein
MSSFVFSKQKTNILMPEKKYNRTTKVLSNQIFIRLKSGNYKLADLEKKLIKFGITIEKPLLAKQQSYTFSKKKLNISENSASKLIQIIQTEEPLLRTFRVSYSGKTAPEILCKELLKSIPEIEIAEPVTVDEMLGSYIPNDKYVYQQGLLAQCKIFDLWDVWKGDTNTVIGISDGGVFQQHEDLINSIAPNWGEIPDDNIDNDGNGYIDDYIGYNMAYKIDGTKPGDTYHGDDHGSGVAGIACATTDNNLGIAGVAFNCRFFPIKTAKKWGTSIIYGYESIIYAAIRGVKVLNCSWGSPKRFSQIDQSIIDFAVARDVAIVAAAGNKNGSLSPFYPASYHGVMSVGNVDLTDKVSPSSSLGAYLDIMAPGEDSYITTNDQGGYKVEPLGGTSFSSPVVAGVLALVRSKYPSLNPLEAIEFTRQMVDDIGEQNKPIKQMLRGRVNGFKIAHTDPMSIPGIVFKDVTMEINGEEVSRIYDGQVAKLKINCKNILGNAANLKFVLSMGYDFDQAIEVIDSTVNVQQFDRNTEQTLDYFTIKAKKDYDALVIFRVDVYGDNNYHDFFMFPFIPTPEMTTFGNNIIKFSVGDRGQIGFFGSGEDIQGIGVNYKNFGNMIYNAGLMLTAKLGTKQLASTAVFGMFSPYTDFISVKPFTAPDKTKGIMNDKSGVEYIGAEIEQVFNIPPDNFNIVTVDITLTNNSGKHYDEMATGYYFDWDIMPNTDSNNVALLPDAIPEDMQSIAAAAEYAYFYNGGKSPYCGCAAYSNNTNFLAAATGMDYSTIRDFSLEEIYASLNTGTNIQFKGIDDINMVVGMSFPGGMGNHETRKFKFLFGCADTKDALAESFRNALKGTDVHIKTDNTIALTLYPLPADTKLNIVINNPTAGSLISFYDITGNKILDDNLISVNGNAAVISKNIENLPAGVYFLNLISGKNIITKKFIVK